MKTLISWGGIEDSSWAEDFTCGEFMINNDVVNHLKIGECIWLDSFIDFVEILDGDQYYITECSIDELKNAILNIAWGASIVENIVYSFDEEVLYKVIYLSKDSIND